MSSGNAKELRKATRAVVQEILPELLQSEVFKGLYEALLAQMKKDLGTIEANIQQSLKDLDSRSKNVQQYIMNEITRSQTKE